MEWGAEGRPNATSVYFPATNGDMLFYREPGDPSYYNWLSAVAPLCGLVDDSIWDHGRCGEADSDAFNSYWNTKYHNVTILSR